jgi:diadenosine tetraphosphatase ApaH/serine/threonine PP2A family protein phosphatase
MLCLGDIVGYYDHPKECLDLVRTHCEGCVKGNHDEYCSTSYPLSDFNSRAAEVIEWTRGELSSADQSWLRALPYILDVDDFSIVHASLNAPERWEYIFDRLAAATHFTRQDSQVCFNGHTHVPVAFQCEGGKVRGGTFKTFSIEPGIRYLVNVGSVGQPRDGRPDAAYVVYDLSVRTVELRRVDYPRPPSGGHGVGKFAPGGGGPPKTLKAHSDYPEDDKKTSS